MHVDWLLGGLFMFLASSFNCFVLSIALLFSMLSKFDFLWPSFTRTVLIKF